MLLEGWGAAHYDGLEYPLKYQILYPYPYIEWKPLTKELSQLIDYSQCFVTTRTKLCLLMEYSVSGIV